MRNSLLLPILLALLLGTAFVPERGARGSDDTPTPSDTPKDPSPKEPAGHTGPATPAGSAGPARVVSTLLAAYRPETAGEHIAFVDRFYREPGNDGYNAVLDRVIETLRAAGFGSDPGRTLAVVETRETTGWNPVRASLELVAEDGTKTPLLAFDATDDRHRTMLPTGATGGEVTGTVVFRLEDVTPGSILIFGGPLGRTARQAEARGAAAILSVRLRSFHRDPSGGDRHLDAIPYGRVSRGMTILCGQISMRVQDQLRALAEKGPVRARWFAEVKESEKKKLRTVVATIVGAKEPGEVVPIAGHVQEPGAVDNASGVGGLLELATSMAGAIAEKRLPVPQRSIAFVWGNEMEQSRVYLEHTERTPIAALSADMIGASRAKTGALPLLERDPDPGAVHVLPPDAHTPWGATPVRESSFRPSGLSMVARLALRDVARSVGGWETREHPYEGGSDHDIFLRQGIPSILFWCFTDFAYHTSLDRLEHVDLEVTKRLSVAIGATAWAIADPAEGDLARYRQALTLDRETRLTAARTAKNAAAEKLWQKWYEQVDTWCARHLTPIETP